MSTQKEKLLKTLENMGACERSLKWIDTYPDDIDPNTLWIDCMDPAWMLWLLVRLIKKSPKYHEYIIRTAEEAMILTNDPEIKEAYDEKAAWFASAAEEDKKKGIEWSKDKLWKLVQPIIWNELLSKNHLCNQCNILTELFPGLNIVLTDKGLIIK